MPECGRTCFLDVSAEEAQNLLMAQGKEGSFIIRPSQSDADSPSISFRHKDSVLHIKIQNTGEVYDLYGGEQFATLMDLVEFYKDGEKLRLADGDVIHFSQPLCSSAVGLRCERWFHGGISSAEAKELLRKQSVGSFLVREGSTEATMGHFVLSVVSTESDVTQIIITKQDKKYSIGDGIKFSDLSKLIDYYRKNPITVRTEGNVQRNLTLQKSVNIGSIVASDIPHRTAELLKRFPGQEKDRDGFWEEFEQITYEENSSEVYTKPRIHGKKEENVKKNRFKNVLPYDETRVVLKDKDETDYINANYIETSGLDVAGVTRRYIATQGCLKHTAGDFWRMIWQERVAVIVMATKTIEMGKNKCFQYWPDEQGSSLTFDLDNGSITVTFVELEYSDDFYTRVLNVTRKQKQKGGDSKETMKDLGTMQVFHFQFPEWADKTVPKDSQTGSMLDFISAINSKQRSIRDSAPVVVHCSAGIGRTGSFILIDIVINLIETKGLGCHIDIPKTLIRMRQMRSGLVQTDAQYKFVYLALREYVERRANSKTAPGKPAENQYVSGKLSTERNKKPDPKIANKPNLPRKPIYENLNTSAATGRK